MGLVLAFQAAPRQASRPVPRRREPAQSADVLFFTGVRYERPLDGASNSTSRAEQNHARTPPLS